MQEALLGQSLLGDCQELLGQANYNPPIAGCGEQKFTISPKKGRISIDLLGEERLLRHPERIDGAVDARLWF